MVDAKPDSRNDTGNARAVPLPESGDVRNGRVSFFSALNTWFRSTRHPRGVLHG
jgi:hypothetical protein